jgi:hypothetical protein
MRILEYVLFTLAFVCYGATVRSIWRLVIESNALASAGRFNRFWWVPAWKIHRKAYPASALRRQIIARFALTFALMATATACLGLRMIQNGAISR